MRSLLCVSLVLLFASAASAQFSQGAPKTVADPAKPADAAANPGGLPAAGGAPAGGGQANSIFAALDLDGDGVISKNELKKAIVSLKKLDTDNDGSLSQTECGGAMAAAATPPVANSPNPADAWIEQLMAMDKNKDGKLTPDELTDNEKQMLQGADINNDGAVDRQELALAQASRNGQGGAFGPGQNGQAFNGRTNNEAMARFFQADRNRDGRITSDEVNASDKAMLQGADANGDGAIDAAELQAFSVRMGNRARALGTGVNANGKIGVNETLENNNRNRKRN
jgi:Ca2+-binding EF-hand superfamily protein